MILTLYVTELWVPLKQNQYVLYYNEKPWKGLFIFTFWFKVFMTLHSGLL